MLWQITVADIVGPNAEEFLLKVQDANKGPPWYMESPNKVRPTLYAVGFVVRHWDIRLWFSDRFKQIVEHCTEKLNK